MLGLAKYGVQKIAMGDIQVPEMRALADEVQGAHPGVECLVLELDVGSEASVQAAVQATVERFGRIDLGLNIAGITGPCGKITDIEFSKWKATMDVNLHGVWLCQRAEIAQMLKQECVFASPPPIGWMGSETDRIFEYTASSIRGEDEASLSTWPRCWA